MMGGHAPLWLSLLPGDPSREGSRAWRAGGKLVHSGGPSLRGPGSRGTGDPLGELQGGTRTWGQQVAFLADVSLLRTRTK